MNVFLSSKQKPSFIKLKWDILVILLLGILSLIWFRGNNLINGGDFGMPLDWIKYLKSMFSVWIDDYSLGGPDYRNFALLLPYVLMGGVMQFLGFSLVFIEKIFFYVWFVGCGLSMYYLCSVLDMRRIGRTAAAIFYMLNPFSLIIIWKISHGLIQLPYAFSPLVLGMYINGLLKKKGFSYIIFSCILWLLLVGSAYANPRMAIVHWLPIASYFLFAIIFEKNQRQFILKYTLGTLFVWLLLNFYWIFPFLNNYNESFSSAHSSVLIPDIEELKLTSVKLLKAIRMLGYWSMKSGYKGDPYYPFESYFRSNWILALSWLIPLLTILGFLRKEVRQKPLIFFIISTLLLGLIGINGANPPIGSAIVWFYKLIPPLMLLARFNFLFFGMPTYLIFSILIGFGFMVIYEFVAKRNKIFAAAIVGILIFLLNFVLVFPFWSGEVIKAETKMTPGERVKVPDYWWEAKNWLNEQKDFFRILPLPMSKTYNAAFVWEKGYSGGDPTRWFTNGPVINVLTIADPQMLELIGRLIEEQRNFKDIGKILGYLNTKYLLLRNDTRFDFILGHNGSFTHTLEKMQNFAENQKDLVLEKNFGKLDFYKVKDSYLLPLIYAPEKLAYVDGTTDSLADITQFLEPEGKEGIIFAPQNNDKPQEIWREGYFDKIFVWREPKFVDEKNNNLSSTVTYELNVPKEGQYDLLLRNDGILKYYSLKDNSLVIAIDGGAPQKVSLEFEEVNLISLGKISLSTGAHQLTIVVPESRNLIADPSFENSLWNGPVDIFPQEPSAPNFSVKHSQDASEGKYSLSLGTTSHSVAVYTAINDFQMGDAYRLTLSAKHLSGYLPYFAIWENEAEAFPPSMDFSVSTWGKATPQTFLYIQSTVPANSSWKKFYFVYKPQHTSQSAGVFFASLLKGSPETVNLFDEVRVERAFTNPVLLKYSSSGKIATPKITFKKINTAKYEVEVNQAATPYFLVFSQAFHPEWKLSIGETHLTINGFANGWYIRKTGDYKFTISFEQQKIYYLSIGVSLAALFLSIGYLGYKNLNRHSLSR